MNRDSQLFCTMRLSSSRASLIASISISTQPDRWSSEVRTRASSRRASLWRSFCRSQRGESGQKGSCNIASVEARSRSSRGESWVWGARLAYAGENDADRDKLKPDRDAPASQGGVGGDAFDGAGGPERATADDELVDGQEAASGLRVDNLTDVQGNNVLHV